MNAGVPASDNSVCQWIEANAVANSTFRSFPWDDFVYWVEIQGAKSELSVRLLTCIRKQLPLIARCGSDKAHRALMRRLSVAVKLLPDNVIPEVRDAWTSVALARRESLPPLAREEWDVLLELANAQHGSKPGKAYLKEADSIISALPEFPDIMRDIIESIGRDGPVGVRFRGYPTQMKNLLDEDFTDLLRALIWLCAPFSNLTEPLRDASERCSLKIKNVGPLCAKIAAACAEVLSRQDDSVAAQALAGLQSVVKHKSTRKGLAKAIATFENQAKTEWAVLEECSVPDFGFSIQDNAAHTIGNWKATLSFNKAGVPELAWSDSVSPPRSNPPEVLCKEHSEQVNVMKTVLHDVRKTWKNQVFRLEKLMCAGRAISVSTWKSHYLDHPIVGHLCRRLLWEVDGALVGFELLREASNTKIVSTVDGTSLALPAAGMVRLWHPAELKEEEILAWEKWVLDHRIIQPFQQALREVHRPMGSADDTEDLRYTGERLHQGAFAALCRERAWNYSFHGAPEQFEPCVHFHGSNMRGIMSVTEEADPNGKPLIWLRILNVRFVVGTTADPVRLDSVPPIFFSEVLRDIGLFISASRGTHDTGWRKSVPVEENEK